MPVSPTPAHATPVSVVIPCYSELRFGDLRDTVESVRAQDPAPAEIVVVVDHNPALRDRVERELSGVTVLVNRFTRGVSGTRNTGGFHVGTPLVAFVDDDITTEPGWLAAMLAPFADPDVVGVGGAIQPRWETAEPTWLPGEFRWVVGGAYRDMPTGAPVRNVWSANLAVRRDAFLAVGGFRTDFGKVGNRSRPEDTEFCLRVRRATGKDWWYAPNAAVWHAVPAGRADFRYFLRRCFDEGRGKVLMARLLDGADGLAVEHHYLRRVLPAAVLRGLVDTLRGRGRRGALRAAAVIAGVAAAALGGLVELFTPPPSAPSTPTPRPEPAAVPVRAPAGGRTATDSTGGPG